MTICEGQCTGVIGHDLRGEGGFGYDPLFQLPAHGCSLAELAAEEKDVISHRAQAIRAMIPVFTSLAQKGSGTP
jgi:XTP/dITP diphosphohydrolase